MGKKKYSNVTEPNCEVVLKHDTGSGEGVEIHLNLPVSQATSIKQSWRIMGNSAKSEFIQRLTENAERKSINE
jgi:hypothetical protein